MRQVVRIQSLQLASGQAPFSISAHRGEWVAVMGACGSGKSRLLDSLKDAPLGQSKVSVDPPILCPDMPKFGAKTTVREVAQKLYGAKESHHAAEVLHCLGLLTHSEERVAVLSQGQKTALSMLPCFSVDASCIVIDGELDRIDPWQAPEIIAGLRTTSRRASVWCATHRVDIAERMDKIAYMDQQQLVFFGALEEAISLASPSEVSVETEDPSTVAALAGSFAVDIQLEKKGIRFRARDGQALAAHLLRNGYGAVKSILWSPPNLEQALKQLRDRTR